MLSLSLVLHNSKRAATVAVKSEHCVLFQVSGDSFRQAIGTKPPEGSEDHQGHPDDEQLNEIDNAIDQLCGSKSLHGGEIIRQYQPNRLWLWKQWHGTILQHNIRTTLMAMLFSLVFVIIIRLFAEPTWAIGLTPDEDHKLIQSLVMMKKVWVSRLLERRCSTGNIGSLIPNPFLLDPQ
jgi:hypothetical protein